jgi:hypothetical protein
LAGEAAREEGDGLRREFIPLAIIAALAAAAIWFFALSPGSPSDDEFQGRQILIPVYPIGPLSEPPVEFSWRPLKGARGYEVEVYDQGMRLVWSGKSKENSLACPAELKDLLLGGQALFYRISAKGRFGKTLLSSEPVLFRLSQPQSPDAAG